MKIPLHHIPEEGLDIALAAKDAWVIEVLDNLFSQENRPVKNIKGHIRLDRISDNVNLKGHIDFTHHPQCARCGIDLIRPVSYSLQALLTPLYKSREDREKHKDEDAELAKEDIEFSFYENEEISLDPILNDEIAMQLPYNYYCREDCKGVCPVCGQNLNEKPCACVTHITDPRWNTLKKIK